MERIVGQNQHRVNAGPRTIDYPPKSLTIFPARSTKPQTLSKFLKIRTPAKINLCLDILKKDSSGYHKIRTVFQEIPEIFDEVIIKAAKNFDNLSILHGPKTKPPKPPIPKNENLALLALHLIRKAYQQGPKKFIHITIKKNVPVSSGLGGASSDAAAVLKGLNTFWNLKISTKKLLALAAKLGMDVPFFILGGTALGTNFGEKITPLPPLKNIKFKIFPQPVHLPATNSKTAHSYSSLDLSLCGKNTEKTKTLIKILKQSSSKKYSPKNLQSLVEPLLHNDFETLTPYKNLPKNHHLSGSGPTTFIITPTSSSLPARPPSPPL